MTEVARGLDEAKVLLDVKRYDEAASLLARIVATAPEDAQAWTLLASAHLGADRHGEAVAAASRAAALAPFDDWPHRLASIAQRHLGKITEAIGSASEACRLAPGEWRAYLCLAQAQLAAPVELAAAERAAAHALRLAPNEPDAYFTAGQVRYAQERWKEARAYQERALALDPDHSGAQNELGRISLHLGGTPEAARHFIQAARSAPGVSIYGRNVELLVQRVLAQAIGAVFLASFALLYLILQIRVPRVAAVVVCTVAIALVAGYGVAQFRQMPPELRQLLLTRRVELALGAIYGAFLIELVTAAVVPDHVLAFAMPASTAVILVAAFIARASLRGKVY